MSAAAAAVARLYIGAEAAPLEPLDDPLHAFAAAGFVPTVMRRPLLQG